MIFKNLKPSEELRSLIKGIWIYENPNSTAETQKIIPDGFSEIIIHYGDPYRMNMGNGWEEQSRHLFSNQISTYFFLENTGASGMIGIKLYPHALHQLFGINLAPFTDRVVDLNELDAIDTDSLQKLSSASITLKQRVDIINEWFLGHVKNRKTSSHLMGDVINFFLEKNGLMDIVEASSKFGLSTRQLERNFKKAVGVSPKFFLRILRFNHIFKVIEKGDQSWVRVALESGFFDQSHFIKNFKEFTGEEPSKYGFDEKNMANFFLMR